MRPNDIFYSFHIYLSTLLVFGLLASVILALVYENKSKKSHNLTLFGHDVLGGKTTLIIAIAFALVAVIHYFVISVFARPTVSECTVSLIPFSSIFVLMTDFSHERFSEVLCSFAVMVVPGIMLYLYLWLFGFLPRHKLYTPLLIASVVGACATFMTEILQLICCKGIFETDDILFGMFGCVFGTFCCIGFLGKRQFGKYTKKYFSTDSETKAETNAFDIEEHLMTHDEIMDLKNQGLMEYYERSINVLNAISHCRKEEVRTTKVALRQMTIAFVIGFLWAYLLPWTAINSSALVNSYDTYEIEYQEYLLSTPDSTDDEEIYSDATEIYELQRANSVSDYPFESALIVRFMGL